MAQNLYYFKLFFWWDITCKLDYFILKRTIIAILIHKGVKADVDPGAHKVRSIHTTHFHDCANNKRRYIFIPNLSSADYLFVYGNASVKRCILHRHFCCVLIQFNEANLTSRTGARKWMQLCLGRQTALEHTAKTTFSCQLWRTRTIFQRRFKQLKIKTPFRRAKAAAFNSSP